jgi:hypothetical protein
METFAPTPAPPPAPAQYTRNCIACGRSIDFSANVCAYCGHDYRGQAQAFVPIKQKSSKPVIGGVLILVAGILAVAWGAMYLALDINGLMDPADLPEGVTWEDMQGIMDVCGIVFAVAGLVAVLGGMFGLMRKHFALAIIGGICGLIGLGFFVGSLLALIGLILVAISRSEFD